MSVNSKKVLIRHIEKNTDAASIKSSLSERLTYTVGKDLITATERDWFYTSAYVVRDRLIDRWMETMRSYYDNDVKRVYYFSMEFLMGRSLMNSLHNLEMDQPTHKALHELGVELEKLRDAEYDAALEI